MNDKYNTETLVLLGFLCAVAVCSMWEIVELTPAVFTVDGGPHVR